MRDCGKCSMCCKLLFISGLTERDTWCPHFEKEKGCGIYDHRPPTCMSFSCLWLQSDVMGENLRPDKCGVMFELYPEDMLVMVIVDKHKALNWQKGEPHKLIRQMLFDKYVVWVLIGKQKYLLLPEGVSKQDANRRSKASWDRKMRKAA